MSPRWSLVVAAVCVVVGLAACGGSPAPQPAAVVTGSTNASTTGDTGASPPLPGKGRPPVVIGDKNVTEQFLLGELYAKALSAQGFSVELNQNIGPTEVTLQALAGGLLDFYPEYLATWDGTIAGVGTSFRTVGAALRAGRAYAAAHGLAMLDPTPFSDTPAVVVTTPYAVAHHLRSIEDLRRVGASLSFGGAPQFQQEPGDLPSLEGSYGFTPSLFVNVAVGEQYAALYRGTIQAAEGATTDGALATGGYRILADPLRVFGLGEAVPIVSTKTLAAEGPAFVRTVNAVSALLTLPVMRQLNAAVDLYHQDPSLVAELFLEAHGMAPVPASR